MDRRSVINSTVKWCGAIYYNDELRALEGKEVFVSACPHVKNAVNIYSKGLALLCTVRKACPPQASRRIVHIVQLPLFSPDH